MFNVLPPCVTGHDVLPARTAVLVQNSLSVVYVVSSFTSRACHLMLCVGPRRQRSTPVCVCLGQLCIHVNSRLQSTSQYLWLSSTIPQVS